MQIKNKWFGIGIVLFYHLMAFGYTQNEKINVVVLDFETSNVSKEMGKTVCDITITELVKTKVVSVVERGQIDKVMKEQAFQLSGAVDTQQSSQLGKLLAAKKVITGSISRFDFGILINVRVVDVEKGEVEIADKSLCESEKYLVDSCEELAVKIASRISGKTIRYQGKEYRAKDTDFAENIVIAVYKELAIEEDTVLISAGRESGVYAGDRFTVCFPGSERKKSDVIVKEIYDGYSKCKVVKTGGCIFPGQQRGPIIVSGDWVKK